jgi:hypothetical protein
VLTTSDTILLREIGYQSSRVPIWSAAVLFVGDGSHESLSFLPSHIRPVDVVSKCKPHVNQVPVTNVPD